MRIGDYVRTKNGIIGKIESKNFIGYSDWLIDTFNYNDEVIIDDWTCGVKEYDILKSSPNIIDLIEVGDYVNGCYVDEIIGANDSWDDRQHFHLLKFNSYFGNSDIKSIVTKEQFSSMEYKVGE